MNRVLGARRGDPADHPRDGVVRIDPSRLEVVDTCVGVMHRTAVPIACTITVAITERDRRRLAIQDEIGSVLTHCRFLNPGIRPPVTGDISLIGHGVGYSGDSTGELAVGNLAVTDLLAAVEREGELGSPLEVDVGIDGERLTNLKFVCRPRAVHRHRRGDVSTGRGDLGDFSSHGVAIRVRRSDYTPEEGHSKNRDEGRHD